MEGTVVGLRIAGALLVALVLLLAPAARAELDEAEGASLVAESPNDVSDQLEESRRGVDSILGPGPLAPVHRVWNTGANWLEEKARLEVGMNYTLVFQHATRARDENDAAGGDLDLFGTWKAFDFDGRWPGRLTFNAEGRHRAASIPPSEMSGQTGSLWPTVVSFDVQDFSVVELYWDQGSFEDGFRFRIGKMDPALILDGGRYVSSNVAFLNAAFSDTPTLAFPQSGLGAAAVLYPYEETYLLATVQQGVGDRTGTNFDLDSDRLFAAVELGWDPGAGLYHVTLWRRDAVERQPSAYGAALTLEKEFGEHGNVVPFLRYSWSSEPATPVEQLLAVGLGLEEVFGRNRDVIGLGLAWGRPHDRSRPDQYVAEIYYRLHLTEHTDITPDLQLIVNPSDAPDRRSVWLFGLRLRTVF